MYFNSCRKRKKNSNWIITDSEEPNLDVYDGKGYTVYQTNEVMVAVLNGNNHAPIELNSSKRTLKCPFNQKVKKCRIQEEGTEETDRVLLNEDKKLNMSIHDVSESFEHNEVKPSDQDSNRGERDFNEINESTGLKESEITSITESDGLDCYEIKSNPDSYYNSNLEVSTSKMVNDCSDISLNMPQSSTNERKISDTVQFYKTQNENKYILHIPYPGTFTFKGKLRITLLTGKIEAFGYSLDDEKEEKTIDIYSPRYCMQITIQSKLPYSIPDSSDIEAVLKNKARLSESDQNKLLSSFQPDDTLLLAEKLFSSCSPIFGHYFDDIDIFFEKYILQERSNLEMDLDCFLDSSAALDKKTFTEGFEWKTVKTKKCNVVCGGKGVGKSTFLKYLMNGCISKNISVLCLDFDPGQTEFTPPGCVSAVLVQKPLLGPNFTHVLKPEKMAFLGFVNVALNPVKYMKAVNHIIQSCRDDPRLSDIPWFVNTMGFNKGIGLDIMVNIIRLLQPDVVVQINSSDNSRNYVISLRPHAVESFSVISFLSVEMGSLNYDFVKIDSCARLKGIGFQSGFKPAQLRDLMTLSYFGPLVSFPYFSLNAAEPRWIHLSNVHLAVNEAVPSSYILKAFNGSLVGLCNMEGIPCAERLVIEDSEAVICKVAVKPEIAPCFGLGIVRGIDSTEKKIYVLTPLSDEELEKVNCLNMGNLSPPPPVFLNQNFVDGPTVYTDVRGTENVQSLKRIFKYVPHFSTGEKGKK